MTWHLAMILKQINFWKENFQLRQPY